MTEAAVPPKGNKAFQFGRYVSNFVETYSLYLYDSTDALLTVETAP
jgi:hypothetical protein